MDNRTKIDNILSRRYWLIENFDWFLTEAIFYRDHKKYFNNKKYDIWNFGDAEGRAFVFGDTDATS
jgi:hypothetical protein